MSAKFCGNCGYALQAPEEDPQVERLKKLVPKEFAERLLKSRGGQVERERRIVTILFCDVKGSTALGETMDPEEVLEIMNPVFDVLIEPVYRYEGTLARLMGDAILAFFGAPIAHEDDPVRAVLAALAMQEKMEEYAAQLEKTRGIKGFTVRVGINTGLVVVGEVGSDLRVEYTAMGDTINVASRFENAAKPGTILISENTARLVKHAFELESLGGLELKGKAEPVPAFRVVGRKAVMQPTRGIEGLHSPLVGRERELQTLQARVDELLHGRGQIVSIMGEAGLGKSRLLAELREQKARDGNHKSEIINLKWLEGRSLSYQTSTPYAPFVDLLDNYFKLDPEATDLDKYVQVKSRIAELLPERVNEIAPFIATLLGIELIGDDLDRIKYLPPPDLREKIFRATLQLFERLAGMSLDGNSPSRDVPQPLVLVFEDLHWADSTSLDLLDRLMALTDRAMLMLIALFRPQRQEPSWRFHENAAREYAHRYTHVELAPLDEQNSRQLVANLLEIEDLPESVRALILKKAEGNPFFVEEVIRSLLDAKLVVREEVHLAPTQYGGVATKSVWRATREIENIAVPDTLAGVITARLDRLDEDSKHVAQTASVIGREFQFDVLRDVYEEPPALDESLRNLQRRELVREKSRMPLILYLFKHALTQETAYASVLLSRRRALHKRVAECLERVEPDAVNDIARHFYEAQDYVRALPYLIGAGERAARAYSIPEAIQYFTKAVQIAKTDPSRNLGLARRAYEGLGGAQTFAFDVAGSTKTYEEMLALAQAHGDVPMQVSAQNKLANVYGMFMGQFDAADQYLQEAERLAQEHGDKPGFSEASFIRCAMCTSVGDFDSVVRYMGQAAQYGHDLGEHDQIARALNHLADTYFFMTDFDASWEKSQEALQLAREIGNREVEAAIAITLAGYHLRNGDLDAARAALTEGYEIATRIGSSFNQAFLVGFLGEIEHARGEYEMAVAHLQKAVQLAYPFEQMLGFLLVQPLAALANTYVEIGAGLAPRAEQLLDHAKALLESPSGLAGGGSAWADVGFAELRRGNLAAARENFQKGLTTPTMFGLYYRPRFKLGMALLALTENNLGDAALNMNEAREFVESRKMKDLYPLIEWTDAQIHAARGDHERALEQFNRAEELAAEMKMRPILAEARLGAAKILDALGRQEEAKRKRQEAKAVIDEMANLIEDEEIKAAFVESAMKKVMANVTSET